MNRNNVLKTLKAVVEANHYKWIKTTRLQEWTPEQRTTMSYSLYKKKDVPGKNAIEEYPPMHVLNALTICQLIDISDAIAGDYKPGRTLIETATDTLGYDAGKLHVYSNVRARNKVLSYNNNNVYS